MWKYFYLQFCIIQKCIIKKETCYYRFTYPGNPCSPLCHFFGLGTDISKVKSFAEVFIYGTLRQIYLVYCDIRSMVKNNHHISAPPLR